LSSQKKVAIVGGTGDLGRGLAARLSKEYEVIIGSRDATKAERIANEVATLSGRNIVGLTNDQATKRCNIAILAIPDLPTTDALQALSSNLQGKLVISAIVPVQVKDGIFIHAMPDGSAAEKVAKTLNTRVVAALHTVPAGKLLRINEELAFDVLVAADDLDDYSEAAALISSIGKLRPLYAGPLRIARMIESITPVLINLGKFSKLKSPSIRIV
jgi:NADPH-dependent F420 reductase